MATIFCATRFFVGDASKVTSAHAEIKTWINEALSVSSDPKLVGVALNIDADKGNTLEFLRDAYPEIHVIPVTPWGKFVSPLNALLSQALESGATYTLMASAGFAPSQERLAPLLKRMQKDTLVSGAKLYGHTFELGYKNNSSGCHCPWNTFALWNNAFLGPFGFQLGGDMPHDRKNAGVEEVLTIGVIQKLFGAENRQVKLVEIPSINDRPDMSNWIQERIESEQTKIESKDKRPRTQLEWAQITGPTVRHIL